MIVVCSFLLKIPKEMDPFPACKEGRQRHFVVSMLVISFFLQLTLLNNLSDKVLWGYIHWHLLSSTYVTIHRYYFVLVVHTWCTMQFHPPTVRLWGINELLSCKASLTAMSAAVWGCYWTKVVESLAGKIYFSISITKLKRTALLLFANLADG